MHLVIGGALTLKAWLDWAKADAVTRGLTSLPAILETLAKATRTLRAADWNEAADQDVSAGVKGGG